MTAPTSPEDAFDIVPYSSLIRSTEVITRSSQESETVDIKPVNPTIARVIKAVQDNPTPKANE